MINNFNQETEGQLFESIKFQDIKDVRNLIDDLNFEQSLFFLNKCIDYSHSKGVFSLMESEIISKSLSIINTKFLNTNPSQEQTNNC